MSHRPRSSLGVMVATAMAALAGSLGSINDFFANSILQPNNWIGGTGSKRSRRGSYKRSNPEASGALDRRGEPSKRPRFLRAAPSWSNPDALMARGNRRWMHPNGTMHTALPSSGRRDLDALYGVGAFIETRATSHLPKAANVAKFRGSHGNRPGKGKSLRKTIIRAEATIKALRHMGGDAYLISQQVAKANSARASLSMLGLNHH